MRVFNENKTIELKQYDTKLGVLKKDKIFIKHHASVEEKAETGHYEVAHTYDNGGKDMIWVVDTPHIAPQEAYDEYEDILVYVPYSEKELAVIEIATLKQKLAETDYKAIKYAEGCFTETEYKPILIERQEWRERINTLQELYLI